MSQIATLICTVAILVFFALDSEPQARTSKALWLPILFMSIMASRAVSQWFGVTLEASADQYLDGSPLDRNVWIALFAIGIVVLIRRGRQVASLIQANGPLVVFLIYCAISTIWSDYPAVALKRWIKALGYVSMVLIVLTDPYPVAAIRRLLARVGFLLVSVSVLFIKYYPDLGRKYHVGDWLPVYTGITTDKNALGMLCLIFGLGSVWILIGLIRNADRKRKTSVLISHCILLAMVLWLFWKANSMTSLSCFLIGTALLISTSFRTIARNRAAVQVLVVVCLIFAYGALFLNVGGVLETMGRNPTLTGRTELWDRLLPMVGNPLFGTGFESFWLGERLETLWSIYWWQPNEAHNGYFEIYLTLGWIGVLLLGVLIFAGYGTVTRIVRTDPETGNLKLAYFVCSLVYNFTETAFRSISLIWIFFVFAILVVPQSRTANRLPSRRVESAPFWRRTEDRFSPASST
jgi:exopolysaccharide production protein ExoQ